MMRSLYSGVTGLQMHQMKMGVIGNNIANVNTVGFKSGRITFQELLSQSLRYADLPRGGRGGINPMQLGMGVGVGSIDVNHTEGSLQSTGMVTDLAILGNGFFMLRDGDDEYFTRVGTLGLDTDGSVINNSNGFRVQGWNADWEGNINTNAPARDLQIRIDDLIPSRASTEINYIGNLDAAAPQGSSVSEEMIVYDSQGNRHNVSMTFEKKAFVEGTENQLKGWVEQYEGINDVLLNFQDPAAVSQPLQVDYTVRDGVLTFDVTLATDRDGEIISTIEEVTRAIEATEVEVHTAESRINTIHEAKDTEYTLDLGSAADGTFTLTVDGATTGEIEFDETDPNETRENIQAALVALTGFSHNDVSVEYDDTEEEYSITIFNQPATIELDASNLLDGVGGDPVDDAEITLEEEGRNAVERLTLSGTEGGVFTLNFFGRTTDPLDYDSSAEEVQAALESLQGVGAGNVIVTGDDGGPYTIEFTGNQLHGLLSVPREVTAHNAEYRLDLDGASDGTFNLIVNGESLETEIEHDATAVEIYDALVDEIDGIGENDVEVIGQGTAANPFVITFRGELSNQPVSLVFDPDNLTGGDNAGLASTIFTVDLGGATDPGNFELAIDGDSTTIDYNATAAEVREAIEGLGGVEVGDVSVSGAQGGPFTIYFTETKNLTMDPAGLTGATNPGLLAGNDAPILEGHRVMGSTLVGLEVLDGTRLVEASSTALSEIVNRWMVIADGPEGLRMTDNEGDGTDHWIIRFDEDGHYLRDNIGNFTFRPDGADRVTIDPDFNVMTQYASDFNVNARDTDGYATGSLDSFTIDKTGIIIGIYSNGLNQELGQIALANFTNPEGLNKEAETLFTTTSNSGLPQIGPAGVGGRGIVSPGDLEMSNVDLSDQFTEMMTTQRGFQANSRTIMTTDQILQELVNLIR